jgi:mitochondrial fission protein ELM1
MCSEACATTVPVYIFAPPDAIAPKHARLHRELYARGLARPLDAAFDAAAREWNHPPLNAATAVATALGRLLGAPAP